MDCRLRMGGGHRGSGISVSSEKHFVGMGHRSAEINFSSGEVCVR